MRSRLRVAPGLWFPLRTTVVVLSDGGLVLHSPLDFDAEAAAAIDALGPVRAIVAPSAFHHLFAGHAAARWPAAELWVSPGIPKKRPDLRPTGVLGQGRPFFADELVPIEILGMPRVREFVFHHVRSRTLLVTDLVFNIHHFETALSHVYFALTGVSRRLAQSPVFRLGVVDKVAAASSARAVLALAVERVVPCHGEVCADLTELSKALARMVSWGPMALPG